ncbi:SpoIIE family protein phosphatase [Geodermatophilus sp. SYSU D00703]
MEDRRPDPAVDSGYLVVAPTPSPVGGDPAAGVLDAMPAALWCVDASRRVTYANRAAERLLGRTAAAMTGRPVTDLLAGDLLAADLATAVTTACRDAAATRCAVTTELPAPAPADGWFALHAWPVPAGVALAVVDIRARRAAQDAAERAQRAAERAGARMALLAAVTAELSGALDGESALGSLARLVVPALADACIVTVVDREGRARDVGSWHADPARRELMARYTQVRMDTMPPVSPVARALRTGTSADESVDAVLALMAPGSARELLRDLGFTSAVVLPLTAEQRTVGVLTLYLDPGRTLDPDDLAAAGEVASRAGQAVDRVHRQNRQAQLAEALQRSLLTDPPTIGGARVVVRYVPATEAAQVGGDWYDAFLQPGGHPVVVIGDVAGHDTAAAAEMGQLRGLLRGIAHYSGAGPAEVLRGLDAAIAHLHTGTLATAAIARVERGGTQLRYANAGHPPPLVVDPDGTVTVLGGDLGDLLLGVDPATVRRETVVPLRPGATVLLYTDGLVERRASGVDEGLARLRQHLAELAPLPLDRLCDELLTRMVDGTPEDDVALVALSV